MDTRILVSCFLVVFIATAHAHFRIGKRSKFANRNRPSTQQLPQSEVLGFFRRINNSQNLCQLFGKSTNPSTQSKDDVTNYVIDKIQSDIRKLKSRQRNPLPKYKALLDLIEEYCLQRALTETLSVETENSDEGLADEFEIYRK